MSGKWLDRAVDDEIEICDKIPDFLMNSRGKCLNARGLICQILAIYIHTLSSEKTKFAKCIKMVDFKGGGGQIVLKIPRDY